MNRRPVTRRMFWCLIAFSLGSVDCQCGPNELGQDPARTEIVRGGDPSTTASDALFPLRYGARMGFTVADEAFAAPDGTLFVTYNRHGAVNTRRYETYSETDEGTFLHASTPEGLLPRPRLIAPREARVGMIWRSDVRLDDEPEFEFEVVSKEEGRLTPWGQATVWSIVERDLATDFELRRRFVEGHGLWRGGVNETVTPLDDITPPDTPDARLIDLDPLPVPARDEDGEPVRLAALDNAAVTTLSILTAGTERVLLADYNSYDLEAGVEIEGTRLCLPFDEDGALVPLSDSDVFERLCPGRGLHAGEVLWDDASGVQAPHDEPYRRDEAIGVPFHDDVGMGLVVEDFGKLAALARYADEDGYRNQELGVMDWSSRAGTIDRAFTIESARGEDALVGILGYGNDLFTARLHQPGADPDTPMLEFATPSGVLAGTASTSATLTSASARTHLTSMLRDSRVIDFDPATRAHTLLGRARLPEAHRPLLAARLSEDELLVATFTREGEGIGKTYLWRAELDPARSARLTRPPILSAHIYPATQGAVVCWEPTEDEPDTQGWTIDEEEPLVVLMNARGDCAYLASKRADTQGESVRRVVATLPGAGRVRLTTNGIEPLTHTNMLHEFEFEHFRRYSADHRSLQRSPHGSASIETVFENATTPAGHWLTTTWRHAGTHMVMTARPGERPRLVAEFDAPPYKATVGSMGGGLLWFESQDGPVTFEASADGTLSEAPGRTNAALIHVEGGGQCEWDRADEGARFRLLCQGPLGEPWTIDGLTSDWIYHSVARPILLRPNELVLANRWGDHLIFIDMDTRSGRTLNEPDESFGALCATSGARLLASTSDGLSWIVPERAAARIEHPTEALGPVTFCQELAPGVFWFKHENGVDSIARLQDPT